MGGKKETIREYIKQKNHLQARPPARGNRGKWPLAFWGWSKSSMQGAFNLDADTVFMGAARTSLE